jgi:hypothetical protein
MGTHSVAKVSDGLDTLPLELKRVPFELRLALHQRALVPSTCLGARGNSRATAGTEARIAGSQQPTAAEAGVPQELDSDPQERLTKPLELRFGRWN